ncbi:putative baseplate assembly protein [Leptolyngbya sp. FACHB-261]|uniref:putative baseplate assembly protein n=1 Tax=Leptolyngbya sp. FACHB-261 TaxID=2692806 RepID=UPI0016898D80|nr:putative baseplate assembly protein [Leptolyngbya sp. FACHB-261]MBD2099871.1 putative baseplate assembly protein [Leptolyngbya sp. FACHB-261]
MSSQYRCKNERRRAEIRKRPIVNGIDYLEVSPDQKTLSVHFIYPLPGPEQNNAVPDNRKLLQAANVAISGGTRREVQVESVSSFAEVLTLRVKAPGDFSTYTLRLVDSPTGSSPPVGFDPQLSQVDFSFRVENFSEFDCQPAASPTSPRQPPPAIDYLAKDYASFRQLMLDRLAVTMPTWQERNPADLGVALVELVSYAADYLSYYQDAVATEAYLGTARKRVSVRRHARLLDYFLHDGCNARAWVVIEVNSGATANEKTGETGKTQQGSPATLPAGTRLLTRVERLPTILEQSEFETAHPGAQVFETMHDLALQASRNEIHFYTWQDEQCCLPVGATQATLQSSEGLRQWPLAPGDVLLFEEKFGPNSGQAADADPAHRHAVRLTQVTLNRDPLFDQEVIEVQWSREDALPFELCLSTVLEGKPYANVSVARGNVVLVDHGYTYVESLAPTPSEGRYRPRLKFGPLTQQGYVQDQRTQWVRFDPTASASAALRWQMRDVMPSISLQETQGQKQTWQVQRDLLNSDRFATEFVVETEDDGRAYVRFGDNTLGKQPEAENHFQAIYRIGNGQAGNVGAEAIAHVFPSGRGVQGGESASGLESLIINIRNPLPARGGMDPEPIEQVRLYAPQSFRIQKRAVTEADYAAVTQRFPGVRKAVATRRWTGSWYTIFITVDREGGQPVDAQFEEQLRTFLERFRLAGHDLNIDGPRFVPLQIGLNVEVGSDYFHSAVKQALFEAFSAQTLANGRPGFFNPDNFTFGQPVYLSQVIATAMQIAGVRSVVATQFQRWQQPPQGELEAGEISFERLEIACLDSDPNAPENGRISFEMRGGR